MVITKFPNGDEGAVADKLKSFFDNKVKTIYSNIRKRQTSSKSNEVSTSTNLDKRK